MHSYIKWSGIEINEEINKSISFILNNDEQTNAYIKLKNKFPELCSVLFDEISENNIKLKFPYSGYLGTDSYSEDEIILKQFLNDSSANTDEDIKPINLSRKSYPLEVYQLFSKIISSYQGNYGWDEKYGILSLHFDDLRGFVCSTGEEEHEILINISEHGVQWAWWQQK